MLVETMTARADQGARTRARLVEEARRLFALEGYAAVSTQAVLSAAQVTRGALYHHFADKRALFEAVFEDVCAEVRDRLLQAAHGDSACEGLISGSLAFLRACAAPSVTRIYLIDGVAVLGWERWWAIDRRYALGTLEVGVEAACAAAGFDPRLSEGLLTLLSGALNQAALSLAGAADPASRAEALAPAVERMIRRLFSEA